MIFVNILEYVENFCEFCNDDTHKVMITDRKTGIYLNPLCTAEDVVSAMQMLENEEQRRVLMGFFKTGKGQYGEGDKFLGLRVPETRTIVKAAKDLPMGEIGKLLESPWHEVRLCGFLVLVSQFERAVKEVEKNAKSFVHKCKGNDNYLVAMERCDAIVDFYVRNAKRANNWDLVDMSCYKILGRWLLVGTRVRYEDKMAVLDRLAESDNLWERRISMVSTMATTMAGDPSVALRYAKFHLRMFEQKSEWSHDLMHKAVGWMLREVGKRCDMDVLREFLLEYACMMPRTALRYTIEQMNEDERRRWMMQGRDLETIVP